MTARKGRKKKGALPTINLGRTFADKDHPGHWYVFLRVGGVYLLCRWERGVLKTKQRCHVRLDAFDFPVYQLLAAWGITSADLDAFMERNTYDGHPDVVRVRRDNKPLNGRTVTHQRIAHVDPRHGGHDPTVGGP